MANIFVRSTTGDDANDGLSWATAKATLAGADAIDVAGDTIYVSKNHSESLTAAKTYTLSGTHAAPTSIICVDDTDDPSVPTVVSFGATITNTLATVFNTQVARIVGLKITSATSVTMGVNGGGALELNSCELRCGSGNIIFRTQAIEAIDCVYGLDTVRNGAVLSAFGAFNFIRGGRFDNPLNVSTGGFMTTWTSSVTVLESFDLSALYKSADIQIEFYNQSSGNLVVRNCKLPENWTGSVQGFGWNGSSPWAIAQMHNCDSSSTNYRQEGHHRAGRYYSETAIVRVDGAADDATPISWKASTVNNARSFIVLLRLPEIALRNYATDGTVTATIELLTNGVTLNSSDIWVECQYPGSETSPMTSVISTQSILAHTAVNLPSSSASWVTTGLASPIAQKLVVSFSPKQKGFMTFAIRIGKPNLTVYVCPKVEIS